MPEETVAERVARVKAARLEDTASRVARVKAARAAPPPTAFRSHLAPTDSLLTPSAGAAGVPGYRPSTPARSETPATDDNAAPSKPTDWAAVDKAQAAAREQEGTDLYQRAWQMWSESQGFTGQMKDAATDFSFNRNFPPDLMRTPEGRDHLRKFIYDQEGVRAKMAADNPALAGTARIVLGLGEGVVPGSDLTDRLGMVGRAAVEGSRASGNTVLDVAEGVSRGVGAAASIGATPGPGLLKMAGYGALANPENRGLGAAEMLALGVAGGKAKEVLERVIPLRAAARVPLAGGAGFVAAGTAIRAATGRETTAADVGTDFALGVGGALPGVPAKARAEGLGRIKAKGVEALKPEAQERVMTRRQAVQDRSTAEIDQMVRQQQQDIETPRITAEAAKARGEPVKAAEAATRPQEGRTVELGAFSTLKAPIDRAWQYGKSAVSGFRSMIERARRGGREGQGAAQAADVARRLQKAADDTRDAEGYGADAFRAEQATGRLFGEAGRARARLQTPELVPGQQYGVAPVTEILEGRQAAKSPAEQRVVDARQNLILRMGEIEVADNVMVPDRPVVHGGTGGMVPFKNRPNLEPRVPTRLLSDIYANSEHPLRQQAVEAHAHRNNIPVAEAKAIFDEAARQYGETGGAATDKTTQSEHRRFWEKVPTALLVNGRMEPLYEVRPGQYGRAFYHGRAARVGFRRAFGQNFALTEDGKLLRDDAGQPVRPIDEMGERYGKETGRPDVFHESARAGSARPVEAQPVTSRTQSEIQANVMGALNLYKAGKLSATALYNVLEPLVRIPESGAMNTLQAYGEALGAGLQRLTRGRLGTNLVERFRDLERHGAIDVSRRLSTHGGVQGIGARAMQLKVGQMQARANAPDQVGADVDAGRLRGLGYDPATAARVASGHGTATEYRDLINRVVPRTTGQRITGQEQKRLEHSRVLKTVFPIMRFALRQVDVVGKAGKAWAESLVRTGRDPKAHWREAVTSSKHLAETLGAQSLVGTGQIMLYSLAFGGGPGLAQAIARFADDPEKAVAQGFMSNALGGPFGSMMAAMRGDRDLAAGIFPVAAARELGDMIDGDGKYRDTPWHERARLFVKGAVPALRVAETGLVGAVSMLTGKPDREQEWREAIKAYRSWARDEKVPDARFYRLNPTETDEAFATAMRKAYRAILQNRSPDDVMEQIEAGLGIDGKGGRNLKSALEARQILADDEVKARLPSLRSRIGERAYANLEAHDALLQSLIDAVASRRSRARPGGREKPQPAVDVGAQRRVLEGAK